nr:MarR family transcriptional regulator [Aurantimonas marianensis]
MAGKKQRKRSVTTHLGVAARLARTALAGRLATLDLYPGQDTVLLAISEKDGVTLRELAEHLSVRPPTITKTVARLIAQGLVEKRVSERDGRQSHAHLADKGADIVDAVSAARKAVDRAALAGFSSRERKTLRKLLQRMAQNLADTGAAPTVDIAAGD